MTALSNDRETVIRRYASEGCPPNTYVAGEALRDLLAEIDRLRAALPVGSPK